MTLSQRLTALQERAEGQLSILNSKEKTKTGLILPFFQALGYDPFDVREVEPEYTSALGAGQTSTVDYALKVEGGPAMLIRCYEVRTDPDVSADEEPLLRTLDELEASVVGITNGITYRFYADLEDPSTDEQSPFFEFNLLDYEPGTDTYLQQIARSSFDEQEVLSTAFTRKYTRRLRDYLARQRDATDESFLRFLAGKAYDGEVSKEVLDEFRPVVQNVLQSLDLEAQRQRSGDATPSRDETGSDASSPQTNAEGWQDDVSQSEEESDEDRSEEESSIGQKFANKVDSQLNGE
jgi:hypothetical protein